MSTLITVSDWLTDSSITYLIGSRSWVVPAVQSVHILAIAIVLSSVAMLNLRLSGLIGKGQSMHNLTLRFYPWIWGALAVLLATGLIMVMGEPARQLLNWVFWTKMGLIVFAVAFTAPVRSLVEDCPYHDLSRHNQLILRTCAYLSLLLWVLVVTAGRWIAYLGSMR